MKCRILPQFAETNDLQRENELQFYLEIITCDPWIYTMDHPKFIVTKPDGRSHLYIKGLYAIIKYVYLMSWPKVLAEDG